MMVIHDGFAEDADPQALALVYIAEQNGLTPLLRVRPPEGTCGCVLGVVYRVNERDVFTGTATVKVVTAVVAGLEGLQVRKQRYAVLLDDPDRPVALACEHGGNGRGELLGENLGRIRARVATVERPGEEMYL
jgi:hypothetical protein